MTTESTSRPRKVDAWTVIAGDVSNLVSLGFWPKIVAAT
jgi:hypothetical protein